MAFEANIPAPAAGQDEKAAQAFEVHAALVRAEKAAPWLKGNPQWQIARMDAYAAFWFAYLGEEL